MNGEDRALPSARSGALRVEPQDASQAEPPAANAGDGWHCVGCLHNEWRWHLGSDQLIECDSCGQLHTFVSVQMARNRRDLERYHQLIFAVARKFPGEERYETALRYIREREAQADTHPQGGDAVAAPFMSGTVGGNADAPKPNQNHHRRPQ